MPAKKRTRTPEQNRATYQRRAQRAKEQGLTARQGAGHRGEPKSPDHPIDAVRHPEKWRSYIVRRRVSVITAAGTPQGRRIVEKQIRAAQANEAVPVLAVEPYWIRFRARPAGAGRTIATAMVYIDGGGERFKYMAVIVPVGEGWGVMVAEHSGALAPPVIQSITTPYTDDEIEEMVRTMPLHRRAQYRDYYRKSGKTA